MLNLWIGMSRGVRELPQLLFDLDYREFAIEKKFLNSEGGQVQPELILTSESQQNCLLLEWKSGENTDTAQIGRYMAVDSESLQRAFVSPTAASRHDVVYVGHMESEERLRIGLEATGSGFPLVLVSADELRLVLNTFEVGALTEGFSSGLGITLSSIPTGFVPIGPESEPADVAEVVMPKILEFMADRRSIITVDEVAMATCGTWGVLERPAREQIRIRIATALQDASREEFARYFSYSTASGGRLTIRDNPLELGATRRTAAYQALLGAQARFLARLSGRLVTEVGEQLDLELENQG